jgi:hypothetical protein
VRNKLLPPVTAALVVVVVIATAMWWLARGDHRGPPGPPVADVYAGIAAALTRPGMVAHVTVDAEASDAGITGTREAWLDLPNDAAHEETTTTYWSPSVSTTSQRGLIYRRGAKLGVAEDGSQFKVPIEGCPGASKRILTLFNHCPGSNGRIVTRTETGRRLDGADALSIVSDGDVSGIDSVVEVHDVLFIDPATHLPLAFKSKGTDRYVLGGYEQKFHTTTRYRIGFVSRDTLPPDFFEPASIGYSAPEPERTLDTAGATFPIFWFGSTYAGDGAAPPLMLTDVRAVDSAQPELGPTLVLTYGRADDEFAELVTVSQMSAAQARFFAATGSVPEWRRDRCATHNEVLVPGAHAVIHEWRIGNIAYDGAPCPATAPDGLALELDFGETLVTVLPSVSRALNKLPNPYATEAALQALALTLHRRGSSLPAAR